MPLTVRTARSSASASNISTTSAKPSLGEERAAIRHTVLVTGLSIGYAPVSTHDQDLTAQRDALAALDVAPDRIYVDHGLTGTNRDRPGPREAMAACRAGDVLVVTKLDRLARSLR